MGVDFFVSLVALLGHKEEFFRFFLLKGCLISIYPSLFLFGSFIQAHLDIKNQLGREHLKQDSKLFLFGHT